MSSSGEVPRTTSPDRPTRKRSPSRTVAPRLAPDATGLALARLAVLATTLLLLDNLGRAQATDEEIRAVSAATGWSSAGLDLGSEPVQAFVVEARLRGQAQLRQRLLAVALGTELAPQGQAQAATWLARQHLGHTAQGVDPTVRTKVLRVQRMSRHALIRQLEQALEQLRAQTPGLRVVSSTP